MNSETCSGDAAAPRLGHGEVAVLLSGGLDSAILTARLLEQGERVHPIYIRCGLRWEQAEQAAIRRYLRALDSPNLAELTRFELPLSDLYGNHWSVTGDSVPHAASPDEAVFLPGRNALLVIKAIVWCQLRNIGRLALAPLGTSPFADASLDYLQQLGRVLSSGGSAHVAIECPFARFDKPAVMRLGAALPLEHTFSCIDPIRRLHCGRCNKCHERRQAFEAVGRQDPTRYALAAGSA